MSNWKPVCGFEGLYEVSDEGEVRSLARVDSAGRRLRGVLLRPFAGGPRGAQVALCAGGIKQNYLVRRLVLAAFMSPDVPPLPADHEVLNINGDIWDNRLSNLAWRRAADRMAELNFNLGRAA